MGAGVSTYSSDRHSNNTGVSTRKQQQLRVTYREGNPLPTKYGQVTVPAAIPTTLPPPPADETGGHFVWFVEDLERRGEWDMYPTDVSERLDTAWRNGQQECLIVLRKRVYTVDLRTMEQRASGSTARSRQVKRVEVNGAHERRGYSAVDPFFEETLGEFKEDVDTGIVNTPENNSERVEKVGNGNPVTSKLPVLLRSVATDNTAFTMMYSNDGSALLTGSRQQLIHWNVETSTVLQSLDVDGTCVLAAVYSPNGTHVVCGGADGNVRMYNMSLPEQKMVLKGHKNKVYGIGFLAGEGRFASASMDSHIRCWDVETMTCLKVIDCSFDPIFALETSKIHDWFALSCENACVCAYDFRLGRRSVTARFTGHTEALWTCALRGDEQQFATAGIDTIIRVWDVRKTNASVLNISHHTLPVHFIEYMPYNRGILSCARDETVRLTDTLTGNTVWRAKAHARSVFRVRYHPEVNLIATSGIDRIVNLWSYSNVDKW